MGGGDGGEEEGGEVRKLRDGIRLIQQEKTHQAGHVNRAIKYYVDLEQVIKHFSTIQSRTQYSFLHI